MNHEDIDIVELGSVSADTQGNKGDPIEGGGLFHLAHCDGLDHAPYEKIGVGHPPQQHQIGEAALAPHTLTTCCMAGH